MSSDLRETLWKYMSQRAIKFESRKPIKVEKAISILPRKLHEMAETERCLGNLFSCKRIYFFGFWENILILSFVFIFVIVYITWNGMSPSKGGRFITFIPMWNYFQFLFRTSSINHSWQLLLNFLVSFLFVVI